MYSLAQQHQPAGKLVVTKNYTKIQKQLQRRSTIGQQKRQLVKQANKALWQYDTIWNRSI